MSKLVKQLKREFKANPKKAAILGLLGVVCAWFWGPLVFPKDTAKKPKAAPNVVAAATPDAGGAATAAAAAPTWRWQDLADRLDRDPRMKSAPPKSMVEAERNPFAVAPPTEEELELDALVEEVLAAPEPEEEPQPIVGNAPAYFDVRPLVLSSTLIGKRDRRAVINGRAYSEGAILGSEQGRDIVLTLVDARRAIVEWNGRRRELKILRPGETPADETASTAAATGPEAIEAEAVAR